MINVTRRAGGAAITTGGARAVLLVGTLATIPPVLGMLGEAHLGVWLTLVTLTSLFGFADLGLGNGVMTTVATLTASDDTSGIRSVAANGFALMSVVAAALGVSLWVFARTADLNSLFGVSGPDIRPGVMLFLWLFIAGLPFSVTEKIEWGLQKGYIAGLWSMAASVLAVTGVLLAVAGNYGLVGLAAAYTGAPLVVAIANTIWAFGRRWKQFRPDMSQISGRSVRGLLRVGVLYFVLQASAAIAFSSDNLIVALELGSDRVPELAVPARLFGLTAFALGLILRPLWPEYARAIAANETTWATRTAIRSLLASGAAATLLGVCLVIMGRPLVGFLTQGEVQSSPILLWALATLGVLVTLGNAISMLYNALGELRFQAILGVIMAASVVGLKLTLVQPLGVLGVALGSVIGYGAVAGPALAWYTPRVLRRLRRAQV